MVTIEHVATAEQVVAELSGAQIVGCHIEGDGLHLQFVDGRVFVIIGLPALSVAMIQPERNLH